MDGKKGLRILHTADWHLGKTLCERSRDPEMARFLDWLLKVLEEEQIDILLIAGDVFDTISPTHAAQQMYYNFLGRLNRETACRHVVVTAGNHDSGAFLDAPAMPLEAVQTHVIGLPREKPEDELLVLKDDDGRPELLVAAVPFLREHEVLTAQGGESITDKEQRLGKFVADRYQALAAAVKEKREEFGTAIPAVAMGHLFAQGGKSGDSERTLYIGSLGQIAPQSISAPEFAYTALGHLHRPQDVAGVHNMRYSGSPLAMGFAEAAYPKSVTIFSPADNKTAIREVPVWQYMETLTGDWDAIAARLEVLKREIAENPDAFPRLKENGEKIWLKIVQTGTQYGGMLRQKLEEAVQDAPLDVLMMKDETALAEESRLEETETKNLRQLGYLEVFKRVLAEKKVPEAEQDGLTAMYKEICGCLNLEGGNENN